MNYQAHNKKMAGNARGGYIALLVVLAIASAGLLLAGTMSLISVGELQSSLSVAKGENTLDFVEGCTEDALLKVRASASYAGGTITRPEGTCSITVVKNGTSWTLTSATTATSYQRTIQVNFIRNANGITITSWKEI